MSVEDNNPPMVAFRGAQLSVCVMFRSGWRWLEGNFPSLCVLSGARLVLFLFPMKKVLPGSQIQLEIELYINEVGSFNSTTKPKPFGALQYEQRPLGLLIVRYRGKMKKPSFSRQGCPKMLGARTEAIGSLEEVSWDSLEVREGFQE